MKIYIVTTEPFPNGLAATGRIKCYAKALIHEGIDVEVVNFHRTEVYGKKPNNQEGIGVHEGILFRYIGGTPLRGKYKIGRYFNDLLDTRRLIKYLDKHAKEDDVIFTYYRQNPMDKLLIPFAQRKGIRIYRELCEYPFATQKIDNNTENKCRQYMENTFVKYTGAICISQSLLDLAQFYHPQGKYIKIPIMIDPKNWAFDRVIPKQLGHRYIFHSGALFQQKDGIVDVLNAFADALPSLPSGTKYLFTGDIDKSVDSALIKEVIKKRNLQNHIAFLGFLSKDDLISYIKGSSLFIIYKNDNIQNQYCFATKLAEYLLSAHPVITTNVGESNHYLTNMENAIIVNPNSKRQLTDAIIHLMNCQTDNEIIGQKGKCVAENHFLYQSQGKMIKDFFRTW